MFVLTSVLNKSGEECLWQAIGWIQRSRNGRCDVIQNHLSDFGDSPWKGSLHSFCSWNGVCTGSSILVLGVPGFLEWGADAFPLQEFECWLVKNGRGENHWEVEKRTKAVGI